MNFTKTYKYLYFPTTRLFYADNINYAFRQLDVINVYLHDTSLSGSYKDGYFYIVCEDTDDTSKGLNTLKTSQFYKDSYIIGEYPKNYVVIVFEIMKGDYLNKFLESKYSEMYTYNLLDSASSKKYFVDVEKYRAGSIVYHDFYHVLTKSTQKYLNLIESIRPNNELAQLIFKQEYDSKIKLHEEVFDSTTFLKEQENASNSTREASAA